MNKTKTSNPVRLIAFFLTAILLICTFGFTVDGWQFKDDEKIDETAENKTDNSTDYEKDNTSEEVYEPIPEMPEIYVPEYINALTGIETTEELASMRHIAFVMNSDEACYGISNTDLLVEIPIENEKTRLISFQSDASNLWKIGSLTNTRGYISNIAAYFDAIAIFDGYDDSIEYSKCDTKSCELDLKKLDGFNYTEFSSLVYTNRDLIDAALEASAIDRTNNTPQTLPYVFNEFGAEPIVFDSSAKEINIVDSIGNVLDIVYDEETHEYYCLNSGEMLIDALNNQKLDFKNCFILFADSVTYDNASCNQMVMDTIGSGVGYYITEGSATEIKWSATLSGVMTFYGSDGEKLIINRGSSYIKFVKSSKQKSIIFS